MQSFQVALGQLQANCLVLWDDPKKALVIDPGAEPGKLIAELDRQDVRPAMIVNTHGHFDHTGAVGALVEQYGVEYRIHEDDVPIVAQMPGGSTLWGMEVQPVPEPSSYLAADDVLELGALRVRCLHTPGHTPGSTCFLVEDEGWLMTGDTLFQRSVGRTDFPGGDAATLSRSIQDVLYALPGETRVTPGHGPDTTIGDEARQNPYVRAATEPT